MLSYLLHPKEVEKRLITELFHILQFEIVSPEWTESPDAILNLRIGDSRRRIAVELTEYFNNTLAGTTSNTTYYEEFWHLIHSCLEHQEHRSISSGLVVSVHFKDNLIKPSNVEGTASRIAKELIEFVTSHSIVSPRWDVHKQFDRAICPALHDYVYRISIVGSPGVGPVFWWCDNLHLGRIHSDARKYVQSSIEAKNKKAACYDLQGAEELWLIIAASATTISNDAGDLDDGPSLATDPGIQELCRNSPIDRVLFWARHMMWYQWIKPANEPIRYGDPYVGPGDL